MKIRLCWGKKKKSCNNHSIICGRLSKEILPCYLCFKYQTECVPVTVSRCITYPSYFILKLVSETQIVIYGTRGSVKSR